MFRMVGRRSAAALVTSGLLALGAAACGDDDSDSGSSGSGGSTTESAPADSGTKAGDTTQGAGVVDFQKYTGGTEGAADASKSKIVIGWTNQQGGPADRARCATDGAKLAVKYVNEELGGVDGHPIELASCFTSTTEEQGQSCGQKFANDDSVDVVAVGAMSIGSSTAHGVDRRGEAHGLQRGRGRVGRDRTRTATSCSAISSASCRRSRPSRRRS